MQIRSPALIVRPMAPSLSPSSSSSCPMTIWLDDWLWVLLLSDGPSSCPPLSRPLECSFYRLFGFPAELRKYLKYAEAAPEIFIVLGFVFCGPTNTAEEEEEWVRGIKWLVIVIKIFCPQRGSQLTVIAFLVLHLTHKKDLPPTPADEPTTESSSTSSSSSSARTGISWDAALFTLLAALRKATVIIFGATTVKPPRPVLLVPQ